MKPAVQLLLTTIVCATAMMNASEPSQKMVKQTPAVPVELRCEYLRNPLGIDRTRPRLSWNVVVRSGERGWHQSAFEILVATSEQKLGENRGDLWSSGKVVSSQSNQVVYGGAALSSRTRCYWKVRAWDSHGQVSAWSEPASWTVGLLHPGDWKADWISGPPVTLTGDPKKDAGVQSAMPSPLLRRTFDTPAGTTLATLYVTALGLYEVRLNGTKVGDHVLAPEWTDYAKRIQYQTYDVTPLVRKGRNVVTAELADGWYIGSMGSFSDSVFIRGRNYGSLDRRFLMQLELETTEGTTLQVVSDGNWRVNPDGPVRSADIYQGETHDARKIPRGWETPEYDDSAWPHAAVYAPPTAVLVSQMNEPVQIVMTLKPVAVTTPAPGVYIFDLGQNMVGWCALTVDEPSGKEITLRHGEMLDDTGALYTANLRRAAQTDRFIADGKGPRVFEPRYTYHGFRYVEVRGLSNPPSRDALLGKVVSSDIPSAGTFECSNAAVNQLWKNILWTQRDNFIGIPTDCPQRDERLGWMADAQVFSRTAMYNSDMAAFYTKWIQDIRDAQAPDGRYPDVAPVPKSLQIFNAPAWADAGVIVPWRMYQTYGDTRILAEHFTSARRFVDFVRASNPGLIWTQAVGNQYGDWLNGNTIVSEGYPKSGGQVPHPVFNTIQFASSARIVSRMAEVLNDDANAKKYADLSEEIRKAFMKEFVDKDGVIQGNTQAGYALALAHEMLPESLRDSAFHHMLTSLETYDYRISTGFLSTICLMNELARRGRPEIAYRLLESHRFPSWLYQIDQGATTVWERWDGYVKGRGFQDPGMNSFNHYAIGSVGEWLYGSVLGIQPDDRHPGFREFFIRPAIDGTLTWAKGKYHSIMGDIVSEWRVEGEILHMHLEIPANTVARVSVPSTDARTISESGTPAGKTTGVTLISTDGGAGVFEVGSGVYDFAAPLRRK